jgi:hypothetical protein
MMFLIANEVKLNVLLEKLWIPEQTLTQRVLVAIGREP